MEYRSATDFLLSWMSANLLTLNSSKTDYPLLVSNSNFLK